MHRITRGSVSANGARVKTEGDLIVSGIAHGASRSTEAACVTEPPQVHRRVDCFGPADAIGLATLLMAYPGETPAIVSEAAGDSAASRTVCRGKALAKGHLYARRDLMTPGRPLPTIVRRTAWEFAGLIVANSRGFESIQTQRGRGAAMTPLPLYARRDLNPQPPAPKADALSS